MEWDSTRFLSVLLYILGSLTYAFPPEYDHGVSLPTTRPLNVAHRGSSGMLPEHTAAAYRLAIEQGADVIECDVGLTRDLIPVCIHDSYLSSTTDVAEKYPEKLNTYFVIDSLQNITDYFSIDFTLEELKALRVRQRFGFRDHAYDGEYDIPTLEEYIIIAQSANHPVGLYPETKNPMWLNSLPLINEANTTFERIIVDVLERYGYTEPTHPCFLQSFNLNSLYRLKEITALPLIRLTGTPLFNSSLDEIAEFCYGIGPAKELIVIVLNDRIVGTTDLVQRAHARGLRVHPFTFRNEYNYLAFDYGQDPYDEYEKFLELEIDGLFTDFPHSYNRYLNCTLMQSIEKSENSIHFRFFSFSSDTNHQ